MISHNSHLQVLEHAQGYDTGKHSAAEKASEGRRHSERSIVSVIQAKTVFLHAVLPSFVWKLFVTWKLHAKEHGATLMVYKIYFRSWHFYSAHVKQIVQKQHQYHFQDLNGQSKILRILFSAWNKAEVIKNTG